jgi:methylenetetrahydrofolate dehydrogenase (NADP+)/methenyltetrahydrofolate cyclohydrolase
MYALTAKDAIYGRGRTKKLEEAIKGLSRPPMLAIVTDFSDPASMVYVRQKERKAKALGITCHVYNLNAPSRLESILQAARTCDGVIYQLPMKKLTKEQIDAELAKLNPWQDVDGFRDDSPYLPCTAQGVIDLLEGHAVVIEKKVVLVIGRGKLAAQPLVETLSSRKYNCTVIQAHSHTRKADLWKLMECADIIISAVGIPEIWRHVPDVKNKILVDIGISKNAAGEIVGDFPEELKEDAFCATPVPGGVGPMTVFSLMENVVSAAIREDAEWRKRHATK